MGEHGESLFSRFATERVIGHSSASAMRLSTDTEGWKVLSNLEQRVVPGWWKQMATLVLELMHLFLGIVNKILVFKISF